MLSNNEWRQYKRVGKMLADRLSLETNHLECDFDAGVPWSFLGGSVPMWWRLSCVWWTPIDHTQLIAVATVHQVEIDRDLDGVIKRIAEGLSATLGREYFLSRNAHD